MRMVWNFATIRTGIQLNVCLYQKVVVHVSKVRRNVEVFLNGTLQVTARSSAVQTKKRLGETSLAKSQQVYSLNSNAHIICCSSVIAAHNSQSYDEYYDVVGCAAYSDGGCPCPEGENKCGGTDWWRSCSALCCEEDEETCYNENWTPSECKPIAEGGCDCPAGETKCYAEPEWNNPGWCVSVCCTDEQEACYDYDTGLHTCADIAAGGCPCPEGEEKCGAVEGVYAGHCIAPELCCNDNEELCYSDDWYPQPENCALISSGGCSCPEGETKCGAEPEMNYAGYCTSLCCEEQTCYDWNTYLPTSCAAWGEDCSTGISFDLLKGKSMNLIDQSTMKTQIAKLHNVKAMKAKMLANENAKHISVKKIVQAEEMAILRKTKRSIKQKSLENNVPIFMTKVY